METHARSEMTLETHLKRHFHFAKVRHTFGKKSLHQ